MRSSDSRRRFSVTIDPKYLSSNPTPRQTVQVFDEQGQDVTPRPLFQSDGGSVPSRQKVFFASDTSAASGSDIFSALFPRGGSSIWPFTRSGSISSQSTLMSVNEEGEDSAKAVMPVQQDVAARREELDEVVEVYITETATISLLEILSVSVSEDANDADYIRERNEAYAELCRNRLGNDKYIARSMQTFNGAPKCKRLQCEPVEEEESGTMATTFDMYISLSNSTQDKPRPSVDKPCPKPQKPKQRGSNSASSSQSKIEPLLYINVDSEQDSGLLLHTTEFQHSLMVMERTILQNVFQTQQAAYRQLPPLQVAKEEEEGGGGEKEQEGEREKDSSGKPEAQPPRPLEEEERAEEEEGAEAGEQQQAGAVAPTLDHLWDFSCALIAGHNVSCMAWNQENPDLLAVGYGHFELIDEKPGLVCCWSLKNPTWPERIFRCDSGVTALDFSASNPNLLAVGMHDGRIAIYNVQGAESAPVMDSSECTNKHLNPQWQVRWIEHAEDRGEYFISVCADGRISKWFLRNDTICRDLMKLNRTGNDEKHKSGKQTRPFISKYTPGLSFAFHPMDSNLYLVGTEEGHIHKFSCSNKEQCLESYHGHKGAVYHITWSPFCRDVFLSCSSDWTIQLWRQDLFTPVLSFTSSQCGFYDVMWSPKWATVFAAANEGQLEVWNLGYSFLDPVIAHASGSGVKTSVLFASHTDCIVVGDSQGTVSVYQLQNFTLGEGNQADTLEDIINRMRARQL